MMPSNWRSASSPPMPVNAMPAAMARTLRKLNAPSGEPAPPFAPSWCSAPHRARPRRDRPYRAAAPAPAAARRHPRPRQGRGRGSGGRACVNIRIPWLAAQGLLAALSSLGTLRHSRPWLPGAFRGRVSWCIPPPRIAMIVRLARPARQLVLFVPLARSPAGARSPPSAPIRRSPSSASSPRPSFFAQGFRGARWRPGHGRLHAPRALGVEPGLARPRAVRRRERAAHRGARRDAPRPARRDRARSTSRTTTGRPTASGCSSSPTPSASGGRTRAATTGWSTSPAACRASSAARARSPPR